MSRRVAVPVLLALPALLLAVAGLFHPQQLDYETSWRWYALHVPAMLLFPLVGAALATLVRGRRDLVSWWIRGTAYVYAVFYTALDVISGVGAGFVTSQLGPDVPRPDAVRLLFRIGTPLGEIGSWALIACCAALALDQVLRFRQSALVGLLLVPGAVLVHEGHIFSPVGVAGMALVGVGTGALAQNWLKPHPPTR